MKCSVCNEDVDEKGKYVQGAKVALCEEHRWINLNIIEDYIEIINDRVWYRLTLEIREKFQVWKEKFWHLTFPRFLNVICYPENELEEVKVFAETEIEPLVLERWRMLGDFDDNLLLAMIKTEERKVAVVLAAYPDKE